MKNLIAFLMISVCAVSASAEYASYGSVDLTGLARSTDWPYNKAGMSNTMVCNVNGPDGFLSIRTGPGSSYEQARALKRLAIVVVDTRLRSGNWVKVVTAYRTHSEDGDQLANVKDLHVEGWAHDGYLCSFIDY